MYPNSHSLFKLDFPTTDRSQRLLSPHRTMAAKSYAAVAAVVVVVVVVVVGMWSWASAEDTAAAGTSHPAAELRHKDTSSDCPKLQRHKPGQLLLLLHTHSATMAAVLLLLLLLLLLLVLLRPHMHSATNFLQVLHTRSLTMLEEEEVEREGKSQSRWEASNQRPGTA